MVMTGDGRFLLRERTVAGEVEQVEASPIDEFVPQVDAMGPQKVARVTRSDAAFARQLVKKR